MNKKLRSLVSIVALLVLAACSSAEDSTFRTPQELSDSLLTVTDMPSGWEESQRQVFDTRSNENPSIDPSIWCAQAKETAAPLTDLAGTSGADVEMSKPVGGGNGASMMRLQAWSNEDVAEYFSTVREVVRQCDGVSQTDASGVMTKTQQIEGHSIGDESVSFSQKTDPPAGMAGNKFSSMGRTTVARFGDVLMVIQLGNAGPTDSLQLMNEDQWWTIVSAAGNKID